jgi:(p)ppGpp synthase/HD superfamily hydrolase
MRGPTEDRAAFFDRLRPLLSTSDLLDVELAYILAKDGHRSQIRRERDAAGRPLRYFEHPRRVALVLIDEVECIERDMVCAALLHDVIEDTRYLSSAFLDHHFGAEVSRLVTVISKVPKEGYDTRLRAYGDWRALTLKACDRLDNLRSLTADVPEDFRIRQLRETREHYLDLFDRAIDLAPREHRDGVARVVAGIHAILAA